MDDKKKKTRSDLLRELESIKGLLVDEDIPVLQEVFAPETQPPGKDDPQSKLNREELAALKTAYQSLLADAEQFTAQQAGATTATKEPPAPSAEKPASTPETMRSTSTRTGQQATDPVADSTYPEANDSLNLDPEPDVYTDNKTRPAARQKPVDSSREQSVSPGQQTLFKSSPTSEREKQQALLNSYGENPFLPQHIRERLRGNRVDFNTEGNERKTPATEKKETPEISSEDTRPCRQDLIEDLVKEVLPQLENQLRAQLEQMSEKQIKALLIEKQNK